MLRLVAPILRAVAGVAVAHTSARVAGAAPVVHAVAVRARGGSGIRAVHPVERADVAAVARGGQGARAVAPAGQVAMGARLWSLGPLRRVAALQRADVVMTARGGAVRAVAGLEPGQVTAVAPLLPFDDDGT